jgi:DNA-binding CsgD family transcriptional regulator
LKKQKGGFVEVAYLDDGSHDSRTVFLEEEKKLLKAIAGLLGSIIEKKEAEMVLKRTADELRKQTVELDNKNIALREIVSQIGLEKKALQDQMRLNIELTVLPLLNKMQNPNVPPESWQSYLRVVQQNLEDITSSFTRKVIEDRVRLSPRELEICNLIKNGLSNKEIAALLQISLLTVERHRHNVRKKLRIDNKKINLATFLRDL